MAAGAAGVTAGAGIDVCGTVWAGALVTGRLAGACAVCGAFDAAAFDGAGMLGACGMAGLSGVEGWGTGAGAGTAVGVVGA